MITLDVKEQTRQWRVAKDTNRPPARERMGRCIGQCCSAPPTRVGLRCALAAMGYAAQYPCRAVPRTPAVLRCAWTYLRSCAVVCPASGTRARGVLLARHAVQPEWVQPRSAAGWFPCRRRRASPMGTRLASRVYTCTGAKHAATGHYPGF